MAENHEEFDNSSMTDTPQKVPKERNYALYGLFSSMLTIALIAISFYIGYLEDGYYGSPGGNIPLIMAFYSYILLIALTGAGFATKRALLSIINTCLIVFIPVVAIFIMVSAE